MKRNFIINQSGSIMTITARTKKATKWLNENVYFESWQVIGSSIHVDSRFGDDIINAINDQF